MTIAVGTITKNSIVVGTDSKWTWAEDFVREHTTSKFVEIPKADHGSILIASAGQDRFTQILRKLIKRNPELLKFHEMDGALELVESLRAEVLEFGIGDPENNEFPEHNMEFLIASSFSKSLWIIEPDYNICEFKDHVCIGSGAPLAESSMLALKKSNIMGEKAVITCIETVGELHPYCGGKIELKEIKV